MCHCLQMRFVITFGPPRPSRGTPEWCLAQERIFILNSMKKLLRVPGAYQISSYPSIRCVVQCERTQAAIHASFSSTNGKGVETPKATLVEETETHVVV